jgi:hypothetical protein
MKYSDLSEDRHGRASGARLRVGTGGAGRPDALLGRRPMASSLPCPITAA